MKILGLEIRRNRIAQNSVEKAAPSGLQSVNSQSNWLSWWGPIRESFAGAWQQNVTINSTETLLAFSAVFSCVTGIASDIAKLRIKLMVEADDVYEEVESQSPFLPVLRKPNSFQTRIKFIEQWIVSKLLYGNAYILKRRDARGIVTDLYVLNPMRVTPMVATNGDVYYELKVDYLSDLQDQVTVPASEIIHDMMVCLWHPLVGVTPIYACGMSATMGNKIQANSTTFFNNKSQPGGMLTAPAAISNETAERLKTAFEAKFSGDNIGRLFVAGDGLEFKQFSMTAVDSQTIEQLKWTVDDVARAFRYPTWKLGIPLPGNAPEPESLNLMYYTDCLQSLIESLELCLDEGLRLPPDYCTELDIDNLMRMDTNALYTSIGLGVKDGWMKPNEGRQKANLPKVTGGDSCYLQQQNFSLEALAKRDALPDPFATAQAKTPAVAASAAPAMPAQEVTTAAPKKEMSIEDLEEFDTEFKKELALA